MPKAGQVEQALAIVRKITEMQKRAAAEQIKECEEAKNQEHQSDDDESLAEDRGWKAGFKRAVECCFVAPDDLEVWELLAAVFPDDEQ